MKRTAVFRAGDHKGEVEGDNALVAEQLGDVPGGDLLGEALGDGGLADPGLADEDGIVLGAAAEDLDDALDLAAASDDGVEVAVVRQLGEVATEGLQGGSLALLAAAAGLVEVALVVVRAATGEIRIELAEDLVAGALDIDLQILEDAGGDAVAFAEEAEEDVLGADVAVVQGLRLLSGEGEDLLHAGRVGDVPDHLGLGTVADLLLDFEAHGVEVEVHLLQDVDRDALAELDEAEEEVLGPHVVVVETVRLLAGESQDLLRSGGEIIHRRRPCR